MPAPGTICTIAGDGVWGYGGDGGPAIAASFYWPVDVTLNAAGELNVADWNNHRIRRIDKRGVIKTIAGANNIGDDPDSLGTESRFNHPTGVAFDHKGNMLIAAWHNSKVKTLDESGKITDTCGDGKRAYNGDGGPAKLASFDLVSSVASDDGGTIFIMDQANQRIRTVDAGGIVTTYAGGDCMVNKCTPGERPEYCPKSQKLVCNFAKNADFCIAPDRNPPAGCLSGFSPDGGPAAELMMDQPTSQASDPGGRIAFDHSGNLVFSDPGNHRVRRIDKQTKIVTTLAGGGAGVGSAGGFAGDGGKATEARLNRPTDIAFAADGTLYIADTENNCIRAVSDGIIRTVAGRCGEFGFAGDGGRPTSALLNKPDGIEVAPNGDLYIADLLNSRIRIVSH